MAIATQIIQGSVGKIYELRTVGKDNTSVVDFSLAYTPRKRGSDGEWTDGETYWITVTAWRRLADNIASSWKTGDRVLVIGRIDMKPGYTNKDGVEVPARAILVADAAGHDDSVWPSTQDRPARSGDENRAAKPQRPAPAPAARPAAKPAPAPAADELNFDFDDDLGIDFGEDNPF